MLLCNRHFARNHSEHTTIASLGCFNQQSAPQHMAPMAVAGPGPRKEWLTMRKMSFFWWTWPLLRRCPFIWHNQMAFKLSFPFGCSWSSQQKVHYTKPQIFPPPSLWQENYFHPKRVCVFNERTPKRDAWPPKVNWIFLLCLPSNINAVEQPRQRRYVMRSTFKDVELATQLSKVTFSLRRGNRYPNLHRKLSNAS